MLSPRHPFYPTFRRLMAEVAAKNSIYDLGTPARFFKEMGLARDLFDGAKYKAGGYKPQMTFGADNCDFDCDLQNLKDFADNSAGAIICLSVLEHVENPAQALKEIHRVLEPKGLAILSVPFAYPYHGKGAKIQNPVFDKSQLSPLVDSSHETYSDFWRFTHEGLTHLFAAAGFNRVEIYPSDGWVISRLVLLGLYDKLSKIPALSHLIHWLDRPKLGSLATMHFVRAVK